MIRVTRPFLNLLVKARIVFRFSGKNIIFSILKGIKMDKIIFLSRKKLMKKKICVPTLSKIFRPVTRNTLIFLFDLMQLDEDSDLLTCSIHQHGCLKE